MSCAVIAACLTSYSAYARYPHETRAAPATPAATAERNAVTGAHADTELEALNTRFRALYKDRTEYVLQSLPLVLVVQNNTITAVRGPQRRLYPVPLQRYNEARAVVHAALAFHGLMSQLAERTDEASPPANTPVQTSQHMDGAVSDRPDARLTAYLTDLDHARRGLNASTLTREEKQTARKVLDILEQAARETDRSGRVSSADVQRTLRLAEPHLSALAGSIGRAHAAHLQTVLKQIKAASTEAEWQNAVAVVTGPMTPRRNNLETAAVASIMGAQLIGERIFYAENIFTVDGALSYLQTLVGDRELSINTFGQPHRMWEDLFAPVSRGLIEDDFYTELGK